MALRKGKWVYITSGGDGGGMLGSRGGTSAIRDSGSINSDILPKGQKPTKKAPAQQLYDLENDLSQTTNVIEANPEVAKSMRELFMKLRKSESTKH